MKLSLLLGGAVGYVLGARAGHERYEQLVRVGRRIAGSQTVQATAGVVQGQLETLKSHARQAVTAKINGDSAPAMHGVNGHHA